MWMQMLANAFAPVRCLYKRRHVKLYYGKKGGLRNNVVDLYNPIAVKEVK
jgi:hypothetical protein